MILEPGSSRLSLAGAILVAVLVAGGGLIAHLQQETEIQLLRQRLDSIERKLDQSLEARAAIERKLDDALARR